MALSQMTFGSCFEGSDLAWFGTSPVLGALITGLVVFKDSNITARLFFGFFGCGEQTIYLGEEIMKCRWLTILK